MLASLRIMDYFQPPTYTQATPRANTNLLSRSSIWLKCQEGVHIFASNRNSRHISTRRPREHASQEQFAHQAMADAKKKLSTTTRLPNAAQALYRSARAGLRTPQSGRAAVSTYLWDTRIQDVEHTPGANPMLPRPKLETPRECARLALPCVAGKPLRSQTARHRWRECRRYRTLGKGPADLQTRSRCD